jgi:ribonuclease MRP protein subunit RMP1
MKVYQMAITVGLLSRLLRERRADEAVCEPKNNRAFSQLAADNQFAVLGIVLLGVLASVHDACVGLVGEAEPEVAIEAAAVAPVVDLSAPMGVEGRNDPNGKRKNKGLGAVAAATSGSFDSGQVVSRTEIAAEAAATVAPSAPFAAQSAEVRGEGEEYPVKRKKGDKSGLVAAQMSEPAMSSRLERKSDNSTKDKKEKKKKKKKGDEFDNLFSSLV